jgi:hypothetical protein
MGQTQRHEMVLERIHPSGMEEWYCPVCARRVLVIHLHPDGRHILITKGEEHAHAGAGQEDRSQQWVEDPHDLSAEEKRLLVIWADWFDEVDFDSWRER